MFSLRSCISFFFNDTAPTEIYPLSLHDALPISPMAEIPNLRAAMAEMPKPPILPTTTVWDDRTIPGAPGDRSEEHTSELQSQSNLVCRLLLEKKKNHVTSYDSNWLHW